MRLPCLSFHQPWVEFMLDPRIGKDVENRPWNTHYRGPMLLHAAKGAWDSTAMATAVACGVHPWAFSRLSRETVCSGGIVGAAVLDGVLEPCRVSVRQWHFTEFRGNPQHGFQLSRCTRLPFRPYSGAQRWFRVELTPEEEVLLREAGVLQS